MKRLFLSAGHSNADPGACAHGHTEAGIVTALRNIIAAKLRDGGADVLTDGSGGINQPLPVAIKLAQHCDIAVEFHLNAASPQAKGVECLSLPEVKLLAQDLAAAISIVLETPTRGDHGWKSDSSGQHHRLGFCREGRGVILELFFITNKDELETYLERKEQVADAITKELLEHARA
jgi:N-acetylmuramoyl-L-alanine amidase